MSGVKLVGTGSALPKRRVTNNDMARMVDTSDAWIRERTGICERRFVDQDHGGSGACDNPVAAPERDCHLDLAVTAARRALQAAGVEPAQVGVCLVANFTAQLATPSTACRLQAELGFPQDAFCLDINAACAGFVYGMHVAQSLLPTARSPYALVVGAEALSRVLDFSDRTTCVLFGDGAGAAVLRYEEDSPSLGCVWGSRGDAESLWVPGVSSSTPSYLHMDGRAVFRFATSVLPACAQEVLDRAGLKADEVDRYVFHQANQRIIDVAVKKLGVDPDRCRGNIAQVGNTSAASVPLLLDQLVRSGDLLSGQRALCLGFGAGLTWAGALIELA